MGGTGLNGWLMAENGQWVVDQCYKQVPKEEKRLALKKRNS